MSLGTRMKPRVTILGIMVAVALIATALVALRSTLEIWRVPTSTTVILHSHPRHGPPSRSARAFWSDSPLLGGRSSSSASVQ